MSAISCFGYLVEICWCFNGCYTIKSGLENAQETIKNYVSNICDYKTIYYSRIDNNLYEDIKTGKKYYLHIFKNEDS